MDFFQEPRGRDGATLLYLQDSHEISFILGCFIIFFLDPGGVFSLGFIVAIAFPD